MKLVSLFFGLLFSAVAFSQIDSAFIKRIKSLDTANILRLDTLDVPNDAITQKLRELRKEKSGLSIETLLQIKIAEERQKDTTHTKEFYEKLIKEVTTGRTSKLIENCMINIYRRTFTEKEIDDLLTFYKSSAGKKMDREFLFLLVESAKGAEQLLNIATKRIQ